MGYTTDFYGSFKLNKKLDSKTKRFLQKLNETRRMKRKLPPKYGIEGEFFVDGHGFMGQDDDDTVIDHNQPPITQPSLWCSWRPNDEGTEIAWDGSEKFYCYIEWIRYLIVSVLAPANYVLNGTVEWQGEDYSDKGVIIVSDNVVKVGRR